VQQQPTLHPTEADNLEEIVRRIRERSARDLEEHLFEDIVSHQRGGLN